MRRPKHTDLWLRSVCILFTIVAAWAVLAHLDLSQLGTVLRAVRPAFLFSGIAIYGLLLAASAFRLHLVLSATAVAVNPVASVRSCLAGHFLYFALFGALGGDTARAAFYARQYGFPLPRVLATAPLDRLLGLAGFLLFAIISFAVAAVAGGVARPGNLGLRWPVAGLALTASVVLFTTWGSRQSRFPALRQFFDALFQGARTLLRRPLMASLGALSGLAVQSILSALLALNLYAVAPEPLPWEKLVWTFPVIAVVAALPITIGGLGTREGAAIALFGLYGISTHHAVAASLLSFVMSMVWVLLGGLVLLSDFRRRPDSSHEAWKCYGTDESASAPKP